MEDQTKKPEDQISEEIADLDTPPVGSILKPSKSRKSGRPTFERPPFAKELFTEDLQKKFDNLPGRHRHFVKALIETGSAKAATKLSGLAANVDVPDSGDIKKMLSENGLGPDRLLTYLHDCVQAEVLIRDRHGVIHKTVDIKTRLSSIAFIFKLSGYLSGKDKDPQQSLVDMFENIDPNTKE